MYKNRNKNYPYYNVRPVHNMRELIDEPARLFAGKNAVCFREAGKEISVTYREFKREVDSLGTALCAHGINGSHIAIIGENSYYWILSYLTVLNSSGVVVPVDKDLSDEDTLNVLTSGECEAVFYAGSVQEKLARISPPTVKHFIRMDSPSKAPAGHLTLSALKDEGASLLDGGDISFTSIVPDTKGLKQLMFTSGTTGKSKGVMISAGSLCFNIVKSQELMHITERCLSVLPYHHAYEATCGILTMLHNGMTICVNESLRMVLPNLKHYKPTEMQIVPLYADNFYRRIWSKIEEQGKADKVKKAIKLSNALLKVGIDLRKKLFGEILDNFGGELLVLICGGAPLKPHIPEFFESIGIVMINGYGITECAPLVSINRPDYHKNDSVGLPLKDIEVRINCPNSKGEGEICVKGNNVMMGYYKNKEATDAAIIDGWFHTGDIGKIDSDGFIYITGRSKNVIVLKNGENIYPEEIEEILLDIELISEVVVSAAKLAGDAGKGLEAEIYPNYDRATELGVDAEAVIKDEIAKYNEKQTHYKAIKKIVFRDTEFDKTTSKKIKRKYN